MRNKLGFTLVEMMLVIAVIAIIAAFSLKTYQKSFETRRVDKTALEMQHILEAALAYNVDNSAWPDARSDPNCFSTKPTPGDSEFVKNYIPNQDAQSTFGGYFCWSKTGESGNNNGERLFWVAMKVPGNNVPLAKRIAAQLPNAVVTSDLIQAKAKPCNASSCYVRAEVVQPGATSNGQGGGVQIAALGNCPGTNTASNSNADSSTCIALQNDPSDPGSKYSITFNKCPAKSNLRMTLAPNFIQYPKDGWPGYTVKNIDAERTKEACTLFTDGSGNQKESCNIIVHASFCTGAGSCTSYPDIKLHGGSAGASYMVACVPKA